MEYKYIEPVELSSLNALLENWFSQAVDGGVLVFVAESNSEMIPQLQQVARDVGYPLVGGVFPELIVDGKMKKSGFLLMHFLVMPENTIVSLPEIADLDGSVNEITKSFSFELDGSDKAIFFMFDGMIPNIASIIDALYLEWGDDVLYMGTNVGSETFQPVPCLFDNESIQSNAVLLMLLPAHTGAIIDHSYQHMDVEMLATTTAGNRVSAIDWRPAFDVYQELAFRQYGVEINKENFYDFGVHYPFGIVKADGELLIRIPVGLDDDGSIFCVGEVPENAMLTLMKAVPEGSSGTIDYIASNPCLNNASLLMTFYCAGRRLHLGDAAKDELLALHQKIAPVKVIGALSLGEIGGSKQDTYPHFHNATITAVPCK